MENFTLKLASFFEQAKEVIVKVVDVITSKDFFSNLELKTIGFIVLFIGLFFWLITLIYKKKTHNRELKEEYELVAKQIVTEVKIEKQLEKEKRKVKKANGGNTSSLVENSNESEAKAAVDETVSTTESPDEQLAEEDFKTSLLEGEDFKTTLLEANDDYKTTLLTNDEDFETSLL